MIKYMASELKSKLGRLGGSGDGEIFDNFIKIFNKSIDRYF